MSAKQYSGTTLSITLFLCSAIWGLYWIPLRGIESQGIHSSWSVVIFNACPLLVLIPITLIKRTHQNFNFFSTFFSALMIGFAFSFYANSLVETSVVRATLLFYLTPIWSTIIGIIWLNEKLTRVRITCIIIALLGLFLLISNGKNTKILLNIGDVFGFLSGVCWAVGGSALKKWPQTPVLPLTTYVFILTTCVSGAFALSFYGGAIPNLKLIENVFPTALIWSTIIMLPPFILVFKISTILFPGRVGLLMMAEVIVAVVSGSLMIPEEKMYFLQWIGAFCILLAALIEVLFGYRKVEKQLKTL